MASGQLHGPRIGVEGLDDDLTRPVTPTAPGQLGDELERPLLCTEVGYDKLGSRVDHGRELDAGAIRGRVIIMPALNLPALLAGQRLSPVDGKNMNRVFPGERNGTITSVIAHYVSTELLPRADAVVDIHSGGKS
ncbi:MAG: succinylglutamate desuccinylase/aspartoacylase family protein, partial [Gaiellales bacterium]